MTSAIKLQRHAVSAAECGWREEWNSESADPIGERIVAVCEGNRIAEAVVNRVPDDTVSIIFIDPLFDGGTHDNLVARGIGAVLSFAVEVADKLQSRYAYVFIDPEYSGRVRDELVAANFRSIDCILELACRRDGIAVDSALIDEIEFFEITANELTTKCSDRTVPFSEANFGSLLQNIIRESHDLKDLPPTTPRQLRKMWMLLDADVSINVVCHRDNPVAMAVLSEGFVADSNSVMVEYFGVHSEFRRRGIGRHLLQMATARVSPRNALVSSVVAEENVAAKAFFAECGFQQQSAREVWIYEPSVS